MAKKLTFQTAFDRYESRRQIGQGGTGFVVEGTTSDGEPVAIKYLDPQKVERKQRKRFQNEIAFGMRMRHPNVIRVLDYGHVEIGGSSTPFYVMPSFDHSLRAVMDDGLPPDRAFQIFNLILTGVEAAHLNNVWHRDLKPENVLLSTDLSQVVVADFGIARFAELDYYTAAETQVADRLANYRYYAPEQIDVKQSRDHRVDIFALGLMLNELFTREIPRGSDPRQIGSVAPQFSYLDALVELMTRQRPEARPQSIAAVKHELASRARIELVTQRYDVARQTVVPNTEPDDPLLTDPIRIIDTDWKDGRLHLHLSRGAPDLWRSIFSSQLRGPFNMNSMPQYAQWSGDRVVLIPASPTQAKVVLEQYQSHVPNVNNDYAIEIRNRHIQRLATERQQRENAARAEDERLSVLRSLKP
jgi:serine/threonine protein kinase